MQETGKKPKEQAEGNAERRERGVDRETEFRLPEKEASSFLMGRQTA